MELEREAMSKNCLVMSTTYIPQLIQREANVAIGVDFHPNHMYKVSLQ
jgi:hypothetical protein